MTNTNNTTRAIIEHLNFHGFKVWRNNNNAVYSVKQKTFRKNPTTLLGVPDIIGYRKSDGKAIFVEVKTGPDKLSPHQINFLDEAERSSCLVFIAKTYDQFVHDFEDRLKII